MIFALIGIILAYSLYVGVDVMIDTFAQQGLKNSRLDYTLSALPMLMDYPVLGTGMGTFKEAYLQYAVPYRSGKTILYYLHNDWLQVGVEVGFLGLLTVAAGYVWFMAKSIRAWFGRRNHFSIGIGGGAIAALLAVGIHAIGEFGLRMPANALTALAIAAVGWNALTLERSRGRSRGLRAKG
jgi:O-antigen ligase